MERGASGGMYLCCAVRRAGRVVGQTSYIECFVPELLGGRGGE